MPQELPVASQIMMAVSFRFGDRTRLGSLRYFATASPLLQYMYESIEC